MAIDYNSFRSNGEISPYVQQNKWWELKGEERSANLFGILKYLQENQSAATTQLITNTRLYGNMSLMGLNGLTYSKLASVNSSSSSRLTYNVCQSVVDTVAAKIAKNKPRPLFLTSGGDYKLQNKAKKLTKFMEGVMYENRAHPLGVEVFRDAEVWGTGILHVFMHDGRITYERIIRSELFVDAVEGFYGKPRSLYRVKALDRDVLIKMFPNKASIIKAANQAKPDDLGAYPTISDQVVVCEAWHLPSSKEATDGCHTICVNGAELFQEEYKEQFFPFVFFHWNKKLFGFWGQSLVEQVQPSQLEINKILWTIQRSFQLAGSFKILLENGSKIVKEHLNNDIGAIVNYSGTPPQYVTPPILPPEVYTRLQTAKEEAFEIAGVSQLSAASKKPQGLDSGKALREYNDIESDRFMIVGQAWEQFFVDLAQVTVAVMKRTIDEDEEYLVKAPGKGFLETIDWQEVQMEEDQYILKCYPVSALPQEPAGRLQTIQELMQAGLIDPEAGRRLLEFPDLDAEEELKNAPQDYLHEILDKMVEDGVYTAPEPYDDIERAHKLALEYYAKYKTCGLEEEKLELFRTFITQIEMIKQAAQPPQPAPGITPQAAPEAQPTSDMIANQPGIASQGVPPIV